MSFNSTVKNNPLRALKRFSKVHNLICDACDVIEDYFQYQILTIVMTSFILILFGAYYILEVAIGWGQIESKFHKEEFLGFFGLEMVLYAIITLFIIESSSLTTRESQKAVMCIHKLLNLTDDLEMKDRLMRLSKQVVYRKIHFTAAGMFNLDRTLIFTVCF